MSKYTPLPHQGEALNNILNNPHGLMHQDRAQYISACGTGKTLVLLWSAEQYLQSLNPNGEIANTVTVFLFPSLTLINQSYESYKQHNSIPGYTPLVVCSDDKVGAESEEEDTAENCLFDVSTDPIQIQNYLDNKNISNKVIFSTYKSAPLVGEALKNTRTTADITIFDEAHRTAVFNANSSGRTQSVQHNSGYALDDKKFPSKKRLFATATPRMYSFRDNFYEMNLIDKGDVAYSMDNPLLYGRIAHEYSMRQAIEDGIITDYKILAIAVNEQDVLRFLKPRMVQNDLTKITQDQRVLEEVAKMLAIKNAYDKYGIKNAIVFNSTIEDSKAFVKNFTTLIDDTIATSHVDGSMNNEQRNTHIEILRAPGKALLSNAKLLSEGHDVPEADFVVFNNKTESKTDIVQRVGRVQRRDKNNPDKIGYILLPIFVNDVNQDIEESLKTNEGLRTLFSTVAALKESDTQLRDWIATRKRIREASLFNDNYTPTDNSAESKIIFTDVFTLQNEQNQKEQQGSTGTVTGQSQTKETQTPSSSPSATTSDVIAQFNNEQYANLMKQWENRIEAVIVGEKGSLQRWHEMCSLLEEYVKEFGKLPNKTTQYKDENIGSWLSIQKQIYNGTTKDGALSQSQINRLMVIDESIFKNTFEVRWNKMYSLLEEYVKEFGKLPRIATTYKDENIGSWLSIQKQIYNGTAKKGTLSQSQINRLMVIDESIFENTLDVRWNKMYSLLEEYVKEFGKLPIATTKYKDEKIGSWLSTLRTVYKGTRKHGKLTQSQIDRLIAIDPTIFQNQTPASEISDFLKINTPKSKQDLG